MAAPVQLARTIGLPSAVALYCGAVLGSGILVLPAIAAETAGPASLFAWVALSLVSFPLAITFASLAKAQPEAGGFSAYVVRAFGKEAGAVAGWIFLAQVPTGTVVASLIAASYLGAPLGLGRDGVFLVAAGVVILAYALNLLGLKLAGTVQAVATGGVLLLVVVLLLARAPAVDPAAFHPFAPHGWAAAGVAATQLFWAFVGWEAITPLAEEFRDPGRDIFRASVISVVAVAVLYVALGLVTVGTHAYGGKAGELPAFARMAADAFGPRAVGVVGILGGVMAFMPMNAYVAGISRLAFGLARSGDIPPIFAALHPVTRVPHRVLVVMGTACLFAIAVAWRMGWDMPRLLPISTSSFLATYVLSMAAAWKLLSGSGKWLAAVGLVACLAVLAFVGVLVGWLVAVSLAALLYQHFLRSRAALS